MSMISLLLESAENGVIKTLTDDNSNGAGDNFEYRKVYLLENDNAQNFENTIRFIYEILEDLGIETGNNYSDCVLDIDVVWGEKYSPSSDDIQTRIKNLEKEIKILKIKFNS